MKRNYDMVCSAFYWNVPARKHALPEIEETIKNLRIYIDIVPIYHFILRLRIKYYLHRLTVLSKDIRECGDHVVEWM